MSTRRLLAWVGVFVSAGLAALGLLLFIIGVLVEFLDLLQQRPLAETLSPTMQVALAGLCLAAVMVMAGFVLVGLLLARQTRRQAPGYGDAYRFMERLQFSQAIPLLEKAVKGGHETSDVLMMLTSAYAHTGQIARAQATADRAVELFPNDPGAYITLANGYRLQASYEEAARALQKAAELAPAQPIVLAELGFVQQMAGDEAAAMAAFRQAAQSALPAMYSVRVYYHLAQAYKKDGDIDQAMQATARMMSAREGLEAWQPLRDALEGTLYGQRLRYEIDNIEAAMARADAATTGAGA
ncbi:MAG: tetratricopeptide repeat protein [Anaerolineae bacterium]|jgi:tetratricopeptide (TPR) repeat protein|nr:tetratricopeptide repeat protein [Anaerolineae bacterium]